MDAGRVLVLRELLAATPWVERTRAFARTLRTSTADPGGLLLVGTPQHEPWHLAAHLDDESRHADLPQLQPTLVRYDPPPGSPAHLSVTLARIEAARRGETVFVVAEDEAPAGLLERAWDARKVGATVVAIEGGDLELQQVAHETLTVPTVAPTPPPPAGHVVTASGLAVPDDGTDALVTVSFDSVQHLVSLAAGEAALAGRPGFRDRLARLFEAIAGPRSHDGV